MKPSKTAITSDASHKFGGPQATCTSDQLTTNPMTPLRFDNSLERLKELKKVLYSGLQFHYKGYKSGPAK